METALALKMLVEEMHSAAVATTDDCGKPQIRTIDMMLYDNCGVYFLTAKGKAFYSQLMSQGYIALSAVKGKKSISLSGYVKNIGSEKLDEIFEKNTYMQQLYPPNTRNALQVFCLYNASGEYFDISEPSHIVRSSITIGDAGEINKGYYVDNNCTGCKICYSVCPQKCIDTGVTPVTINQEHCVHCGNCIEVCPRHAILIKR